MRALTATSLLFVSLLAPPRARAQEPRRGPPPEAQLVSFPGLDGAELKGFLYVPPGKGPFPAVLWNHGSERLPGWQPELARFYNGQGFVFFLPHRRGQGRSPGPYIMDQVTAIPSQATSVADGGRRFVALHEQAARDVEAALAWLLRRPEVDPARVVMSGLSFGGIQTVLAAEKGLGVRAFVAFAPGAMSWRRVPALGDRLRRAAHAAKAPLLVVQATNDYDLGPGRDLGAELAHRADHSGARIFPPFGATPQEAHGAFATQPAGIAIWGPEVTAFFKQALGAPPPPAGR